MMKRIYRDIMTLILTAALAALAACANTLDPPQLKREAETGTVYIVIDGDSAGPRTLAPALAITRYTASFAGPETQADVDITVGSGSVSLAPGNWTITVTAFIGTESYDEAGRGSATVTVVSGETATADIIIGPITGDGKNGDFSYSVTIPSVDSATLRLTNVATDTTVDGTPIDLKAAAISETATGALTDLDAGYYLMTIRLEQNEKYAGRTEVVHIYDGLETKAVYVFTDSDFPLTVTFNANGGTPVPVVQTVPGGGKATIPPPMTKANYDPGGWYKEIDLTTPWNFDTDTVTGNITLYAKWIPVIYDIDYHLDVGGTNDPANPLTYTVESETITLAEPTRAGYTFDGWYDDGDFSEGVTEIPAGSTGTKTFYAKWTGIAYTVEYDKNALDATGTTASSNHTYGTPQNLTANGFARTGYDFAGWSAQDDGGGTSYTNSQSVSNLSTTQGATVTLYAKWTGITYTVRYNANGGSGNTLPSAHTYGTAKALTTNGFTRTGFIFVGWKDGDDTSYANGQSVINLSTTSATIDLYAQWENTVQVTISLWVNEDDGNILGSDNDVTISKGAAGGNPASFTATVESAYSGIQWYLYSDPVSGSRGKAQSITINAADYANGNYYLGVTVTKDGKPYSTDIHFTVTN
jgi:uncharacterized repeat protein (TIGR02543 family)